MCLLSRFTLSVLSRFCHLINKNHKLIPLSWGLSASFVSAIYFLYGLISYHIRFCVVSIQYLWKLFLILIFGLMCWENQCYSRNCRKSQEIGVPWGKATNLWIFRAHWWYWKWVKHFYLTENSKEEYLAQAERICTGCTNVSGYYWEAWNERRQLKSITEATWETNFNI